MRRLTLLFLVLSLLTPALVAKAAVLVHMPLDDLIRNADLVVRAKVLSSQAFRHGEDGHIYTRHTLAVTEYLKGKGDGQATVVTMGGEMEEVGQLVPGEARLVAGEEVVLCLAAARQDHVVFNMGQGKFAMSLDGDDVVLQQQLKGIRFAGQKAAPAAVKMTLKKFRQVVQKVSE
jgi:hypothetical protein